MSNTIKWRCFDPKLNALGNKVNDVIQLNGLKKLESLFLGIMNENKTYYLFPLFVVSIRLR